MWMSKIRNEPQQYTCVIWSESTTDFNKVISKMQKSKNVFWGMCFLTESLEAPAVDDNVYNSHNIPDGNAVQTFANFLYWRKPVTLTWWPRYFGRSWRHTVYTINMHILFALLIWLVIVCTAHWNNRMNCVHIFCNLHVPCHRLGNEVVVINQNHLAKLHGPWGVIGMVQACVYVKMFIRYNSIFVYTLLVSRVQIYCREVFELW